MRYMSDKFNSQKDIGIKNIVGSGKLPVEIDTDALAEGLEEIISEKSFTWQDDGPQPGLYYEVDGDDGPQVTFHMSGSYIIRADNRTELEESNTRVLDELKELGVIEEDYDEAGLEFTVQNVVALAELNSDISLSALSIGLGTDAQYEPEVFPALDYSTPQYPCSFLVYANGKVIIVGAKSEEDVRDSMDKFYDEMQDWIELN